MTTTSLYNVKHARIQTTMPGGQTHPEIVTTKSVSFSIIYERENNIVSLMRPIREPSISKGVRFKFESGVGMTIFKEGLVKFQGARPLATPSFTAHGDVSVRFRA